MERKKLEMVSGNFDATMCKNAAYAFILQMK